MNNGGFFLHPGKSDRTVVFLPGFATDYRIFESLAFDANRVFPIHIAPHRFVEHLYDYLKEAGIGRVTLFGWSLGAFLASDFAERHPEFVERMVLVGARKRYDRESLNRFEKSLLEKPEQCLREFYARCFLPTQRSAYLRFRETLLSHYIGELDEKRLIRDLQYLHTAEIRPNRLSPCPMAFVHGARDVIAPLVEAEELAAGIPDSSLHILQNASHAAFLDDRFHPLLQEISRSEGET